MIVNAVYRQDYLLDISEAYYEFNNLQNSCHKQHDSLKILNLFSLQLLQSLIHFLQRPNYHRVLQI